MSKKFKLNILFVFLILIFSISAVSASENTADIQINANNTDSPTLGEQGESNDLQIITSSEKNIDNYQSPESDNLQSTSNSYSNLENQINNTKYELNITQDYVFNNATDSNYTHGISIMNKTNFVINGNGHIIDGANQARMFSVVLSDITINNLIFCMFFLSIYFKYFFY